MGDAAAAPVRRSLAGLSLGLALLGSLSAQFVDRANSAGVDVAYPTTVSSHGRPELDTYSVGGASCACDLDGDGWTDLIVARAGAPCLVLINNRNGTFREEASLRGLDAVADVGGIAVGDFSNSGHPDIFLAPVAGGRFFLMVNDGTGHFREAAVERGADATVPEPVHFGQSVSLVDYDRDGYLDIHVTEWNVLTNGQNELHSVLLRNRGAAAPGHFENKTAAAGLVQPAIGNLSANYAAAWADFDGDGYPDLFIAGDFGTSQLWWNNGDGTFYNGTVSSRIGNSADGMGVTLLDYDGDGKIDIFLSAISLINQSSGLSYLPDNKLFRNLGNRQFAQVAAAAGVAQSGWSWGTQSLDANNDGWPDLVVTNGWVTNLDNFAAAKTDPTKLFINHGGAFADESAPYGITDTGLGRSVAILDYDNDGREDIFLTQTVGHRYLYHNEGNPTDAHWLNLQFAGTRSNRDGYGCEVTVTAGGRSQFAVYNPTNAYLGQREPRLHFGLGASTLVSRLRIKWPSGVVQEFTDVAADQSLRLDEGLATSDAPSAPAIIAPPRSAAVAKDGTITLSVTAVGSPAPVYDWFKNGVRISGASGPTLKLGRIQPSDAGDYTVRAINQNGTVTSEPATITVTADLAAKTVARWWNEALLDSIRKDTPNPPVHARNLYHLSATLWDVFWAYERNGWSGRHEVFTQETPALPADEPGRLAAQQEAMSYAAYTIIHQRFANSPGQATALAGIDWLMHQYGYDPALSDATGSSPAAVGLRIGRHTLAVTLDDGANETGGYRDATGYLPANPALVVRHPGTGSGVDPDRWQPLDLVNTVTQNGIVLGASVQTFVGSNARNTRTFALARAPSGFPADDPGAPPRFNSANRAEYIRQALDVLTRSSQLTTADGAMLDISPGAMFNNPLGTNDGHGHAGNPVTGQPYAGNVVRRGDYARVLAEFWADGPNSETPPGHWNVLFNEISDHALNPHKFQGAGAALRRIEWDVCGYLALNGAVHDAACAAWTLKWEYDSARPITMIRYLASLGQSSDPAQPAYHPDGLPLIPGQIEVVTAESAAPGQRHAALAGAIGQIAVKAWLGTPPSPAQTSGVGWILAVNWIPYQRETFVTPAFPGYISGHSTFSRAAAEVLARFTGSDFFPGGLATYDFEPETGLGFEAGPSQKVQLQWATYFDASDQAGLSRLYGGIHIPVDDFVGRQMGSKVGIGAYDRFLQLYNPPAPATNPGGSSGGTTTTPPAPSGGTTTPSDQGGGGGGGAVSPWFLTAFLLLLVARMPLRKPV